MCSGISPDCRLMEPIRRRPRLPHARPRTKTRFLRSAPCPPFVSHLPPEAARQVRIHSRFVLGCPDAPQNMTHLGTRFGVSSVGRAQEVDGGVVGEWFAVRITSRSQLGMPRWHPPDCAGTSVINPSLYPPPSAWACLGICPCIYWQPGEQAEASNSACLENAPAGVAGRSCS